jgi:hypothetical protein
MAASSTVSAVERTCFGMGASPMLERLRHFRTAVGLMPQRRARALTHS